MNSNLQIRAYLALMCCIGGGIALARGAPDRGVRFDSPGVLDLAERPGKAATGKPLASAALDAAQAAEILAAPAVGEDPLPLKFSDDEFGCKATDPACVKQHEATLLAAADGTVKRLDKRLVIAPGVGTPVVFVDWAQPTTKTADGDDEKHLYLGRMPGNGYHRVEVQFGQDAPGNFLVNPKSGKVAFVHNAADIAAPAPDGLHLLTFNTLNPPLILRVAALDSAGPRLALACAVRAADDTTSAQFKGWHDAGAFDIVLTACKDPAYKPLPLRITLDAGGGSVASADAAQLAASGLTCKLAQ